MEISGWDVAAVFAKAVTYAATFGAAGVVFFSLYCGTLLRDRQRALIRRLIAILVGVAAAASVLANPAARRFNERRCGGHVRQLASPA